MSSAECHIKPGLYEALSALGNGVGPAFNVTFAYVGDVFIVTHACYPGLSYIVQLDVLTSRGIFERMTTTLDVFRRSTKRLS